MPAHPTEDEISCLWTDLPLQSPPQVYSCNTYRVLLCQLCYCPFARSMVINPMDIVTIDLPLLASSTPVDISSNLSYHHLQVSREQKVLRSNWAWSHDRVLLEHHCSQSYSDRARSRLSEIWGLGESLRINPKKSQNFEMFKKIRGLYVMFR